MSNKRRRKSKIERSPNMNDYIEMKKAGATLNGLSEEAEKRGEEISAMAFWRYFTYKHNLDIENEFRERVMKVETDGVDLIQNNREKVVVIDEITRNLATLQQLTGKLVTQGELDTKTVNACTNLLRESRQTLEYLDKKRKSTMLEEMESQEMGIAALTKLLVDIPSNCPHCNAKLGLLEKLAKKLTDKK